MKLTTTLNLTKQNNQCQFSVEIDLDNNADIDEISAKTHNATAALKIAVNSIINIRALNTPPPAQQLPADSASPCQIKYLQDLACKSGTSLKSWCKDHSFSQEMITGAQCKE